MNYYQHHIGDFNNATRHMGRLERSIYRDLLDLYYDTEKPLNSDFDKLARRCLVNDSEKQSMRDVLSEFFVLLDDGYHNERADKEIASYHRMAEGGKRGAAKRWSIEDINSHPMPTLCPPQTEANANHEPRTNNQEPITKNHKTQASPAFEKTNIASVCIAIKAIYVNNNKAPVDISQSDPTLKALVEAGASVEEFTDAAQQAIQKGVKNIFRYALGIVKGQRETVLNLNIHKGAMPAIHSREVARQAALNSIFTPENTRHLDGEKLIEGENG